MSKQLILAEITPTFDTAKLNRPNPAATKAGAKAVAELKAAQQLARRFNLPDVESYCQIDDPRLLEASLNYIGLGGKR